MTRDARGQAAAGSRATTPPSPAIFLQPFHETDAAFFARLASDERVTRFVGDGTPWDRQYTEGRINAALKHEPPGIVGASRWLLAMESTEPVGIVVSMHREEGIEIGYWVSPDHWGRGVAGAMVDAALVVIPDLYGTRELLARVHPDNAVSARLLTRRGFQFDGNHGGLDHYRLT